MFYVTRVTHCFVCYTRQIALGDYSESGDCLFCVELYIERPFFLSCLNTGYIASFRQFSYLRFFRSQWHFSGYLMLVAGRLPTKSYCIYIIVTLSTENAKSSAFLFSQTKVKCFWIFFVGKIFSNWKYAFALLNMLFYSLSFWDCRKGVTHCVLWLALFAGCCILKFSSTYNKYIYYVSKFVSIFLLVQCINFVGFGLLF